MPRQDKHYNKTREDFDRMKLEDRAAFLIEATFSTAADALDRAGQELADFVEDMERRGAPDEKQSPKDDTSDTSDDEPSAKSTSDDA